MSSDISKDAKGQKIQCRECSGWYHRLDVHVSSRHSMNVDQYLEKHPGAPTISEAAKRKAAVGQKSRAKTKAVAEAVSTSPKAAPAKADSPAPEVKPLTIGSATLYQVDIDTLCSADRALIPEHDPNWALGTPERDRWEVIGLAIQHDDNLYCAGPTGCGKSASVLQLGSILNQPVRRVNCHRDMRSADFVGQKVVSVDPETNQSIITWRDGVLPDAMRKGHWLLLDEVDALPAGIAMTLQAVLEHGRTLVLTGNEGEVVRAHERFRVIATGNTLGSGDETGLYAGTNIQNEANLDRYGVVVEFDYPDVTTETSLVAKKSGLSEGMARKMVMVAREIRQAFAKEEVFCTFSTRRLINWGQYTVRFGGKAKKAAAYTVLNRMNSSDRQVVEGVIQRVIG